MENHYCGGGMTGVPQDYIDDLFKNTNFGEPINRSSDEKRKLLKKSLKNQLDGYWSGHTIYNIMIDGGFLIDAKTTDNKKLTSLGELLMGEK